MSISVTSFPYGMYGENTYVISDDATSYKAIIDPGYYSVDVRMAIESNAFLKYILLTHGHHDHYYAAEKLKDEYSGAVLVAPEKEKKLLYESPVSQLNVSGVKCPVADRFVKEGDTITLGATELRVIETPGHTEGGICFATDNEIFTGDTLFRLSVGRTDLDGGDWDTLQSSIRSKLYILDDDLTVYPGHGEATTIGFEKKANPFV